jgi:GAF domain-containing protein
MSPSSIKTSFWISLLCACGAATSAVKACSCELQSPEESFAVADVVFSGTGAAIVTDGSTHHVFVDLLEVCKGELQTGGLVRVDTANNSAACGVVFQVGEERVIFAVGESGALGASSCVPSAPISRAQATELFGPALAVNPLSVEFQRGDVNGDGGIDIADPINSLVFQFQEGCDPPCLEALDFHDDADEKSDLTVAIARNNDGTPIEEEGLMISQKIPDEVMKTGQGLILEDLLAPEKREDHPSTIEIGVRSAMCVPLRARPTGSEASEKHILGVLYVDSTTRSQPFFKPALHAFESLASEAAQAIFNSQLYEECLEKRELDAEMRIAQTIQQNILPPMHSRTRGWSFTALPTRAGKSVETFSTATLSRRTG